MQHQTCSMLCNILIFYVADRQKCTFEPFHQHWQNLLDRLSPVSSWWSNNQRLALFYFFPVWDPAASFLPECTMYIFFSFEWWAPNYFLESSIKDESFTLQTPLGGAFCCERGDREPDLSSFPKSTGPLFLSPLQFQTFTFMKINNCSDKPEVKCLVGDTKGSREAIIFQVMASSTIRTALTITLTPL